MNVFATARPAPRVSVVVIGRNEGERLARCLQSVQAADWRGTRHELIYVDSRSTDGSAALAASHGARVLTIEGGAPCAARARNLGWRAAAGEFVLFLDGDTALAPGFVSRALAALADPAVCAAWGHRRESNPGQSLYTRVLDLDWVYPVGRSLYFGGDALVRRAALEQVGGFDDSLKAGEEPELCARLRQRGWAIEHIDTPMTTHDLAIRSLHAYLLRGYRSGIAYAEVARRARSLGDPLWQREAQRDLVHGLAYAAFLPLLAAAALLRPLLAAALLAAAAAVVLRSAWRCRWKAPGRPGLALLYALHSHAQKLPALAGQFAWRRRHARGQAVDLVDYKDMSRPAGGKALAARLAAPLAWLRRVVLERAVRLWAFARLQEGIGRPLDPSNVVLGPVELHGTRNVRFGRNALIYPGVYLETQGAGCIEIGDGVVLSRGVHVVAFDRVVLRDGCMVGEYSSLRDANHRTGSGPIRTSGHDAQAIEIAPNAWLGRGVAVLRGVSVGRDGVVGANAVVTHAVAPRGVAVGIPARERH